ncbi:MAG: hypothetical protein P1U56_06265 [Saprospiraceae bacterium]|nr:hypothetical protein [Saprospiraceae bacterium]
MNTEFQEEQKFDQWWLQIFLAAVGALMIYTIYKQLILGLPVGDNPISDSGLIVIAILVFLFIGGVYIMRLNTKISKSQIEFSFYPFGKKVVKWEEVQSAEVITYGFVGGWGIRLGTKYGVVYNVKGNKGLALTLVSGKKYLIGTQKSEELAAYLNRMK